MEEKEKENKALVYIPENARTNINNGSTIPPETLYNNRMKIFDKKTVGKIVGGKYGRKA